jgi:hypothetical protein
MDRPTVRQLVDAVDSQLAALKSPFAVEYRPGEAVRPDKTLFIPRNATISDALEDIAHDTALTWYPWGKIFLIVPKEEQIHDQLAKTLTLRFPGVEVSQVLSELSERSGVKFEIEPGAIQRIPQEFRTIHMVLDNSSVTQALETIAGFTGLGYVVTPRGVYVWNQSIAPVTARDPIVGMITLPDSAMVLLVPQSQVPPDMRDYFKQQTQKELEKVRQHMVEQGFKPTTSTTGPGGQEHDHQ